MIKRTSMAMAAAVVSALAMTGPVHAFSVPPAVQFQQGQNGNIAPAHVQLNFGIGFWSPERDGRRCGWRHSSCRHFYRGYWYERPWWMSRHRGHRMHHGSRHVQWCFEHYRSYDSGNDTWRTHGGDVRVCMSPYR